MNPGSFINFKNAMSPKQLLQQWVDAFYDRDIDALAALYAEDAVNHSEYAFLAKRGIRAHETNAYVSNSNRGPVVVPFIVR